MNYLNFNTQPNTPPFINDIAERSVWCKSNLAEIERNLDEVDREVDSLRDQLTWNHVQKFHDPFAPGHTATTNRSRPPPALTRHSLSSNPIASWNSTQSGPIGLGVFEEGHPWRPDLNPMAFRPTPSGIYTPPPRTLPVSMVYRNGEWADPLSPVLRTIPLPPLAPGYENRGPGHHWGGSGDRNRRADHSSGSGTNVHQSIQQWAGASVQRAEAYTSLATAKPNNTENDDQSESSSPTASISAGGYNRRKNSEGTTQRLTQICGALGIPPTEPEILTLQKIIEHLGGRVPVVNAPPTWVTRTERARRKREARRACYEELQRLVGPPVEKLVYLRVLDSVLVRVTVGDGGETPRYEPYRVLRL